MEGKGDLLFSREIRSGGMVYSLTLLAEDLSRLYPGMIRYTLRLESGGKTLALLRTNTYEYSPGVPLDAESFIRGKAAEWEKSILAGHGGFIASREAAGGGESTQTGVDALIIQGSPRADGNCSILAGWAAEGAGSLGMKARVVYLDDLSIRPCIGCYQCYNTGSCTFDDDMTGLIGSLRAARLLVICTPVYTNTVPGALKTFMDRCQAYHAERSLFSHGEGKKGLLFSVAGRTGKENFECVRRVVISYLRNLGITMVGEILLDGMDRTRDVRILPGVREEVARLVRLAFGK